MKKLYGTTFCGNEASRYGKQHNRLDWSTFSKAFDAVLNNDIMGQTDGILGYWEPVEDYCEYTDEDGNYYTEEEYWEDTEDRIYQSDPTEEVYQWYIVSDEGANLIREYQVGYLYYNETLDMYLWGVTHFGTSWDYVLTDIELNAGSEAFNN